MYESLERQVRVLSHGQCRRRALEEKKDSRAAITVCLRQSLQMPRGFASNFGGLSDSVYAKVNNKAQLINTFPLLCHHSATSTKLDERLSITIYRLFKCLDNLRAG